MGTSCHVRILWGQGVDNTYDLQGRKTARTLGPPVCDFSEGCWVMSIASLGVGGSANTPTLLSTSDVPCNKKMLHLRKVVRAASLRTLLPRKLMRNFRRLFAVAPMRWVVFLLLGLRAVSGRISHSHQHMRPWTLQSLPSFPASV